MKMRKIGRSDLLVSEICLGSMTWGTQNTEAEGHAQIDRAKEVGINFIDTAEMYPVNPVRKETAGDTEEIIGQYFAARGGREDWVIASKIAGVGNINEEGILASNLEARLDASLKRLQTDYIDLYQFHWPNRGSYAFRQNWKFDPSTQPSKAEIEDNMRSVLEVMGTLQKKGKVREFGTSNESTWGMAQWLRLAEEMNAPRMQSIQNEYSLMFRMYDTDLAELAVHEDITLLAYSPLAAGILSGKYEGGTVVPKGSRMDINGNLGGRVAERTWPAERAYVALAKKHGLDPTTMAVAWTLTRPFDTMPIIGATSVEQLEKSLDARDVTLSEELLKEIEKLHKLHPMPY
ncbi:aldo/keto reductase [Celeribacter halophilus]|jgi:aryl-alcohol dehydrogenase-like predicted oxidoreductase|uniref:Aldo/keto reductase n=1 Tax=Celeribacter halophilus TaxID=576117 RepID=A0AAW7XPS1_9RHOB|nr:aldo/keto reductase [Celeribacter halophilus]MDO6456253.1 aldo/keto reductase [Celeribacter halophilus]MDO6722744.1 aldo/keto reductase [Celeribacter halophilus]